MGECNPFISSVATMPLNVSAAKPWEGSAAVVMLTMLQLCHSNCFGPVRLVMLLNISSRLEKCSHACRFAPGTLWANPWLGACLIAGRLVAASVELWVVCRFLHHLLVQDVQVGTSTEAVKAD